MFVGLVIIMMQGIRGPRKAHMSLGTLHVHAFIIINGFDWVIGNKTHQTRRKTRTINLFATKENIVRSPKSQPAWPASCDILE